MNLLKTQPSIQNLKSSVLLSRERCVSQVQSVHYTTPDPTYYINLLLALTPVTPLLFRMPFENGPTSLKMQYMCSISHSFSLEYSLSPTVFHTLVLLTHLPEFPHSFIFCLQVLFNLSLFSGVYNRHQHSAISCAKAQSVIKLKSLPNAGKTLSGRLVKQSQTWRQQTTARQSRRNLKWRRSRLSRMQDNASSSGRGYLPSQLSW